MRFQKFIHFISFCSIVTCCNPDWFPYGENCYRGVQFDYDVRLARRYCQIFRGDLAIITDNATLSNISPILFENSNEISYWVNENSTISPGTPSSSSCSYIYTDETQSVKLGTDGNCDDGKQFVCEVPKTDSDYICPTSWSYYGNTCYKTFKNSASYLKAVSFCSLQRAKLAVLDDIAKEHNAAAVIIGQKDVYLVAALKEADGFKWSSGNSFQPSCSECISNAPGECMGFSSDSQHPTMFTWKNLNCTDSNYYMCEMQPFPKSTTQVSTETTTLPPLQCPVGYNWKVHEESGFCYWETTYESERLNWYQARQFCQAFGGDLATYDDAKQEEHGLGGAKGHYRGLWFGLRREKDGILHWVDNVTRSYTNWYRNESNMDSVTKVCAKHGSRNSQWEMDYCGVRRWFICKSPKTRDPTMPDLDLFKKTPCNFSGPSVYKTQWYLHEDHCYLVRDEAKYSWNTAGHFCQDNGGYMASVHSFEETDFILKLLATAPNTDFWIGLSARGVDSSLTWSDGTPLQFLYWDENFNITATVGKCVNFDKQNGSWKTEHCNRFLGVICKRGVNASYDFTTPEPTPIIPGNCERGWYRFGNKCYKTSGDRWSKRANWNEARESCKNEDATLVSIHSSEEQDFLTDILLDYGTSVWIGLENIDKGTVFKWDDETALDYTNWNVNEPLLTEDDKEYGYSSTSHTQLCVKLDFETISMGKWSDTPCYRSFPYLCQKFTNPTITEPSEDPFTCRNITGWSKLGSSCFRVFEEEEDQLSWVKAQAICRTYNANLVTFSSSAVNLFLQKRIKKKSSVVWIGTRETKRDKYESVRKNEIKYTNWLGGQPQRATEMDNCVSIDSQGKWIVRSCKEKHSYICEWTSETEQTSSVVVEETVPTEICETMNYKDMRWTGLGDDYCYYFSDESMTWNDAMGKCHKMGAYLASFHSTQAVSNAINYMKISPADESAFHIGLGKRIDGSYGWVDHSALDFTHYEGGRIRQSSLDCVKMTKNTATWTSASCQYEHLPFICSISKGELLQKNGETLEVLEKPKAVKSQSKEEVINSNLSAGSIVGIVFSLMLVFLVIGGVVYRLYPSRTVKPTLLEPDNL